MIKQHQSNTLKDRSFKRLKQNNRKNMKNSQQLWMAILLIVFALVHRINARTLCQQQGLIQDQEEPQHPWEVIECTRYVKRTQKLLLITDPGVTTTYDYILDPVEDWNH